MTIHVGDLRRQPKPLRPIRPNGIDAIENSKKNSSSQQYPESGRRVHSGGNQQRCGVHPILLVFRIQFNDAPAAFSSFGELAEQNLKARAVSVQVFIAWCE